LSFSVGHYLSFSVGHYLSFSVAHCLKGGQFLLHVWHLSCYFCSKPGDKSFMRKCNYRACSWYNTKKGIIHLQEEDFQIF
jgi:hypothetical protein